MHVDQVPKRRRITAEIVQKQVPARMFAARSSGASVYVLIQSRQMKKVNRHKSFLCSRRGFCDSPSARHAVEEAHPASQLHDVPRLLAGSLPTTCNTGASLCSSSSECTAPRPTIPRLLPRSCRVCRRPYLFQDSECFPQRKNEFARRQRQIRPLAHHAAQIVN